MKNFEFTLVLAGKRQPSDDLEDAIFEAGCDDATLSFRNAIAYLDFDREATSFNEAVISAIEQLENSKMCLTVERVEPTPINTPTHSALLLVDGYNIIGSWTSLKLTRDRDGLETARQELVERLLNYTTHQGYKTQIVFDSQYQKTTSTEELYGPHLSVYFTAWTQTADTYIEKFCAAFSRKQDRGSPRLIVATSDRDQQLTVVGYGAECMSAQLLAQNVEKSIQDLKRQQRSRSTQSSRFLFPSLDSNAQEKLAQWWHRG